MDNNDYREELNRERKNEDRSSTDSSSVLMKGATILAVAGIISKIFGGIFRIPLTNMIGMEGQSYYSTAYPVYQLMYSIATAGFPVAISKMVSERIATGDYINAHKSYKLAMRVSVALGTILFLFMFIGAGAISSFYNNPGAEASMRAVSFALLFTPLLASLRGYYQGRQEMFPTALTEVIEQLARVIVGLSLAYAFYKISLKKAAAGATFGASAGVIVALLIMLILYRRDESERKELFTISETIEESDKARFKELIYYVVPIIIGSSIMPIMFNLDAAIVIRRLVSTGWPYPKARDLYGLMAGYCDPIVGLPFVFVDAILISMMPAISRAYTLKQTDILNDNVKTGLKTMMLLAFPCMTGLIVLARPILQMLYYKRLGEALMAVPTMRVLAVTIVTLAVMRGLYTSLQGIGRMMIPVWNLLIGVSVKAVVSYILIGIPAINVNGAAAGSVIAYLIAGILNYRALRKYADIKLDLKSIFTMPLLASLIMGAATIVAYKSVIMMGVGNAISTLIAIIVAVLVYFVTIFKIGAVSKEEIELIPKGDMIYRLAVRIKIAK